MARCSERQLEWTDIISSFEAHPYSDHVRNALGIVGRLKDEGARFRNRDCQQFHRWERCCTVMETFLKCLDQRRETQDMETAMREFFQEFEHSNEQMYQMLYGTVADPDDDLHVRQIVDLFNVAYRASTYALVSAWIYDKQEDSSLTTFINLTTGETRQEGRRTKVCVPRRYQGRTKPL